VSRLDRERRLRTILRSDGWVTVRASMGIVDLVLMRAIYEPAAVSEVRLVQVKSTAGGPYERFGPADRQALLALAHEAGATAWLIWWPPRQPWRWIASSDWP
jgi:Holliday junction resolvase